MIRPFPLLLLSLILLTAPALGDDTPPVEPPPPPDPWRQADPLPPAALDALDTALAAQFLTRHDLSFQKDPVPDAYRLSTVQRSLDDPLAGYSITWDFGHACDSATPLNDWVSPTGWHFINNALDLHHDIAVAAPHDPNQPPDLAADFARLRRADAMLWGPLDADKRRQLFLDAPRLATEDETASPYAADELAARALGAWDDIRLREGGSDWANYVYAALTLAAESDAFARLAETLNARPAPMVTSLLDDLRAQGWRANEGSEGNDSYQVHPGDVIFDYSGDDTYRFVGGVDTDQSLGHLIIDLSGNDLYIGMEGSVGAAGGAVGQTSILIDQSGDDVYRTGPVSQGAAIFGVGVRIDRGDGRDFYDGGDFTEGAGLFGIGVSFDEGGNDSYNATLYGQGAALTGGLGLCLDRDGNDRYYAGGTHRDYPRWPEHNLSLSQGCAFGLRPTASGGIAFLGDFAGNDFYDSEVFGQGVGYWYAMGMLLDKSGHDWYQCLQYGQGAGIHLASGCLIDAAGIDHYNGWADLQGTGHDLGVGLFLEVQGRDYMTCNDLSQGAGNANAIGIAIDLAGDDAWLARNPDNNQGYGNPRRDFGSIGVLLDLQGKDAYNIPGHGDGLLWTGSQWGVGYDTDAPAELAPVKFINVSGTSGATR
ncbi:MAG: hypothetical protein ABI743_06220 [bacterium]